MQNYYIDDLELTKMLMKEIDEKNQSKRKMASEELTKAYILIIDKMLTSSKYSGYTLEWKEDFRCKADELFVKHWYKFKPERMKVNLYMKNGKYILKKPEEYRGAHGWFSLLSKTGIHDEIKRHKKYNSLLEELAQERTKEIYDSIENHLY